MLALSDNESACDKHLANLLASGKILYIEIINERPFQFPQIHPSRLQTYPERFEAPKKSKARLKCKERRRDGDVSCYYVCDSY